MTMYFPLVVHGAMLIEPTESESKEALDRFADTLRFLAEQAKAGDTERFIQAPRYAPTAPVGRNAGCAEASPPLEARSGDC